MRNQINFSLFLGLLFIIWLFYSANIVKGIGDSQINKPKEISEIKGNVLKYEVVVFKAGEIPIPLLFDKTTGEVWKYFYDENSKGMLKTGFTPLYFAFDGNNIGQTPEAALEAYVSSKGLKK